VKGNDKTVDVFNAIEARAKAAGRPLAAALGGSSTHMATIYAPQANVTVTHPKTGVPIVGYYTGAGVLSDSKKFPNFIRLYPTASETQHIYRNMAVSFVLYPPLALECAHDTHIRATVIGPTHAQNVVPIIFARVFRSFVLLHSPPLPFVL
jgi:hypothetical protein